MIRTVNLLILLLFLSLEVVAGSSSDKYEKLKSLYEAGKYEDCAFKAENFTFNEDMKKDPEPYLYISMCYYQLSLLSEKEEEYPKAFDDAFKYAAKAKKYDKTDSILTEYDNYFFDLKEAGIVETIEYFNSEDYSKSGKYLDKILKFCPEDDYLRLTKGICDLLTKNITEGSNELKLAFENIDNNTYPLSNSTENSQKLLADAFIKYSLYLTESNFADSSRTMINIAKEILPQNTKLQNL